MAVYEVPVVAESGPYSFKISLDGITLNLGFRWNWRMQKWIMSVSDSNNNLLIAGIPLVLGVDLLGQHKGDIDNIPQGYLFVQDTTRQGVDPNYSNFGRTVFLCYDDGSE